jgi:hypothetical protein
LINENQDAIDVLYHVQQFQEHQLHPDFH